MAINKNYLQLEFGTGLFFEYSKEEKQGYDKHVSTKGNTSYRKYYKEGISGILESVSIYDGSFGKQISMNIKNGDDVYYVPVDIADQRGNVDTYAESLIKVLPKINKGDNITVRAYNFIPEGGKYSQIGVSVSVNGEKLKGLTNAYYKDGVLVDGDIPAITWKEDALGKKKPSAASMEAKDDYLLNVLKEQTERLKWEGSTTAAKEGEPTEPPTDEHVGTTPRTPKPSGKQMPTMSPNEAFESATNIKKEGYSDLHF